MTTTATAVALRPITPGDGAALLGLFYRLSPDARYARFLTPKDELTPGELRALTVVDHHRDEALVAVAPGDGRIVGVARYAAAAEGGVADFAVAVEDAERGRGLATALSWPLVAAAAANGVHTLTAATLASNVAARALLRRLGFRARGLDHGVIELALDLGW